MKSKTFEIIGFGSLLEAWLPSRAAAGAQLTTQCLLLALSATLSSLGLDAYAAGGTINFANHSSSKVINGQTSLPVTTDDGVRAALYWAPLGSTSFTQLWVTVAVGTPLPGLFAGGTRTNGPATPGGSSGQFRVRAWNGGYATHEEAFLHADALIGESAVTTNQTGDPWGSAPTPPGSLIAGGFSGFTLTTNRAPVGPPVIVCATDTTVECGSPWAPEMPTAVDGCTSNSVPAYLLSTVTNGQCAQVIILTWAATNSCNADYVTCTQTVTVTCSNCPIIAVAKQCPPSPVPPGGTLAYTGTVSNMGNVTLTGVLVVNDQPAPNTVVYGPATLAPGAGAQFSASYRVPPCSCGPFVDTLTASGTSIYGGVTTNSFTATCPGTGTYAPAGDFNGDGIVDQAELDTVLANYWASCQWVCMTNPTVLGGGFFQYALTNAIGWNFTVLASTNLVDWTSLPSPAYPVYQFYDEDAASKAPMRAYRLRWP